VIADPELPAGSVLWLFDQTDMAAANMPCAATPPRRQRPHRAPCPEHTAEVEKYTLNLLETCAKDGGFMLENGAVLDDAKPECLKAMIETGATGEAERFDVGRREKKASTPKARQAGHPRLSPMSTPHGPGPAHASQGFLLI